MSGDIIPTKCHDGVERNRQTVFLIDDSIKQVKLTVWGTVYCLLYGALYAGKLNDTEGTAVVLQNVLTQSYNGRKTLCSSSSSVISGEIFQNDVDRCNLQLWFNNLEQALDYEDIMIQSIE